MILLSTEKAYFRGADGYETARRETVWNGILPERFPDVIVQARDADDVVAAIHYARDNGHHVGVRSGGHSWAASHLRDGGLLLDVSRLDDCTVERMSARAKSPVSLRPNWTRKGCSFPPAIAKASASAAICCRADTAGTVRCSARPARA
jgi:FAD/FMN-containing dehydrogenase